MKKIVGLMEILISMNGLIGSDFNVAETPDFYWTPKKINELRKVMLSSKISQDNVITENEAELWKEWNKFTAGLNPELQKSFLRGIKEELNEKNCQGFVMTVTRSSTNEAPEKSIKFKLDHHILQWEAKELDKAMLKEQSFLDEIPFQVESKSEVSNFYQKEIVTFDNIRDRFFVSRINDLPLYFRSYDDLNLGDAIAGREFYQSSGTYAKRGHVVIMNISENELRKEWNKFTAGLNPEFQENFLSGIREELNEKNYQDFVVTVTRLSPHEPFEGSMSFKLDHHILQWKTNNLDKDVLNEQSFLDKISFQIDSKSEASSFCQKEIVTFDNIMNQFSIDSMFIINGSLGLQSYDFNLGEAIAGREFYQVRGGYEKKEYIASNNKVMNINEAKLLEEWNELVVGLKPKYQEELFKILKKEMKEEGCVNLQMTIKRVSDMPVTLEHSIMNMNHIDEEMFATPLSSEQIKYEFHVTGKWIDKGKWRWIKYQGELEENGKIIFNNNMESPRIFFTGRSDNPQIIFCGFGRVHDELEPLEPSLSSRFCNACSNLIQRIGECLSPQRSANSARGELSYENLP